MERLREKNGQRNGLVHYLVLTQGVCPLHFSGSGVLRAGGCHCVAGQRCSPRSDSGRWRPQLSWDTAEQGGSSLEYQHPSHPFPGSPGEPGRMGWGFASDQTTGRFRAPKAASTSCCFFFSPTFHPYPFPQHRWSPTPSPGNPRSPALPFQCSPLLQRAPNGCCWKRVAYNELCPATQHVPGTTLGTHSKANRDRTTHCSDDKSRVSARSWQRAPKPHVLPGANSYIERVAIFEVLAQHWELHGGRGGSCVCC